VVNIIKGKVYIYPIISFILSFYVTTWESTDSNFVIYSILVCVLISFFFAFIGIVQAIKLWKYNNKILSTIIITAGIVLIFFAYISFLYFFSISSLSLYSHTNKKVPPVIRIFSRYRKIMPHLFRTN
jgi:hypothetical protein